jgi:hypothetical protein
MKNIIYLFCFLFLLSFTSCDSFCLGGKEKKLGNNFRLINEDIYNVYILYCTSKGCCDTGFSVIPSKIEKFNYNNKWIIAKSVNKDRLDNYWIVNKDFEVDLSNCDNISCDSIIKSNIFGPFNRSEFKEKKSVLKINIDLK